MLGCVPINHRLMNSRRGLLPRLARSYSEPADCQVADGDCSSGEFPARSRNAMAAVFTWTQVLASSVPRTASQPAASAAAYTAVSTL